MDWFKQPTAETLDFVRDLKFSPENPAPFGLCCLHARAVLAAGIPHAYTERKLALLWGVTRWTVQQVKRTVGWPGTEVEIKNQPSSNQVPTSRPDSSAVSSVSSNQVPTKFQPRARDARASDPDPEEQRREDPIPPSPPAEEKATAAPLIERSTPRWTPPKRHVLTGLPAKAPEAPVAVRLTRYFNEIAGPFGAQTVIDGAEVPDVLTRDEARAKLIIGHYVRLNRLTDSHWIRQQGLDWEKFSEKHFTAIHQWLLAAGPTATTGPPGEEPGCGRRLRQEDDPPLPSPTPAEPRAEEKPRFNLVRV